MEQDMVGTAQTINTVIQNVLRFGDIILIVFGIFLFIKFINFINKKEKRKIIIYGIILVVVILIIIFVETQLLYVPRNIQS